MSSSPSISVIVPNYNNRAYLPPCLESILAQDHADLELLVIDDCSSDGSREIIESFARRDWRVMPLFNDENLGVARNRHRGILQARGRYITTLDSDDLLLRPDKLRREYEVLQARENQGDRSAIAFSNIVLLRADGERMGVQNATIQEGDLLNAIVRRSCLIPRDFLLTREQYLAAGGYDPRFPIYEDWDLKIRLAKDNRFYYAGIEGIGYRRHGTGLSSASPLAHAWWLSRIFLKNFGLLRSERPRTLRIFSGLILRMVSNHLKNSRSK